MDENVDEARGVTSKEGDTMAETTEAEMFDDGSATASGTTRPDPTTPGQNGGHDIDAPRWGAGNAIDDGTVEDPLVAEGLSVTPCARRRCEPEALSP